MVNAEKEVGIMKKVLYAGLIGILIIFTALSVHAQGRRGWGGENYNYCPHCGAYLGPGGDYGYGPGPGMMGGYFGTGPGMMERGYGMGPGMVGRGYGPGSGRYPGDVYRGSNECRKFFDETVKERRDLELKRFEYFEAVRNPGVDAETVGRLAREMHEIRQEIAKKAPPGCWSMTE